MKPKFKPALTIITACLTLPVMAADITWDAGGANDNWSTFDNWSDNLTPAGDDIIFNNTGGAAGTTVTSIVDTSFSIDSLNFRHDTSTNHTLSISSGQTLTVTGSFTPTNGAATAVLFGLVTNLNIATATNTTTLTGLGTLTVNNSAAHFLVGFANDTSTTVTVDMSGLANFNATSSIFGVGREGLVSGSAARQQPGILRLSKNSGITATQLSVGDTTGINGTAGSWNNGNASTLFLGAGGSAVNSINATTISTGIGKASGNLQFNTGVVSSDKVTIRGITGGSSAVTTWDMGYRNMSSSSGTPSSTVNFGVGEVNAIITSLNIARWGSAAGTSGVSPSGAFSTGTNANSVITVTTANLALNSGGGNPASAQTMNGTLNIQGGVFSATTVNLATGANQTNLTRTATLNVDGGTFRFGTFGTPVGGFAINLRSGAVSSIDGTGRTLDLAYNLGKTGGSTVTFGQSSGGTGTIALNGAGTLVDATTVQTLVNTTIGAGNLGGATSLTKTGAATLTLTGTLAASVLNVNVGTVSLGANDRLSNSATVTVAGGILDTTGSNFTDTVADFNMSSGSLNGGGTITAATYDLTGGTVNAKLGAGAITVNTGTVTLGSAGRLNAASTVSVQGGQLTLAGAESVASYTQTGGTLAGTGQTLTSAAAYGMQAGSVTANLGGSGIALNKTTSGTVTLSGANTYSGATNITGGTLAIGTGGSIANTSQIIVGANTTLDFSAVAFTLGATVAQTLSGTGNINGAVTIGSNGTLAIGTSPGTMTFNNNLGLNAGSISNFEINGFTLGNYDLALAAAAGSQTVTFGGGTLNLLFQSGFNTLGTVKIFDFDAYTGGGFTSVVPTGLASGFTASFNPLNGIVTVIPEPSAALLGGLGALFLLRRRRD